MAMHLGLIGGFGLRSEERAHAVPEAAQRVLALLAVRGPMQRCRLAALVWPDKTDDRAEANLRTLVWRLRRAVRSVVEVDGSRLALDADVVVDLHEHLAWCHRVIDGPVAAADLDRRVDGGAELLPDWYDDWVVAEQERFRQLQLHALEALAGHLLRRGRCHRALDAALCAVAAEPLRESAHRVLVLAHLASGNPSEALRAYERYRLLLDREMGLGPSPAMEDLADRFRPARPCGPAGGAVMVPAAPPRP
jgi:DNA-binding SARP family transcriptional activator